MAPQFTRTMYSCRKELSSYQVIPGRSPGGHGQDPELRSRILAMLVFYLVVMVEMAADDTTVGLRPICKNSQNLYLVDTEKA